MIRRGVTLLMLGTGLIGGWFGSTSAWAPPIRLGDEFVLHGDFHVHGFLGDGVLPPPNVVLEARRRGLHVFALTNHNQTLAAKWARWFARAIDGPLVLVGEEITNPRYHLIGVGLEETVDWRQSAAEALADVHAQGGVGIAAHPSASYQDGFSDVLAALDGTELAHPLAWVDDEHWRSFRRFSERVAARGGAAMVGSSDFHVLDQIGVCRTVLRVAEVSEEGVLAAIRSRHTATFGPDGRAYGDPLLVEEMEAGRVPPGPDDYEYRGSGPFDRVTRWIGWAGLVFLALGFARRSTATR